MGATAAIVTSMGLIAGLTHGAHNRTSIIAGLLIIALMVIVGSKFLGDFITRLVDH